MVGWNKGVLKMSCTGVCPFMRAVGGCMSEDPEEVGAVCMSIRPSREGLPLRGDVGLVESGDAEGSDSMWAWGDTSVSGSLILSRRDGGLPILFHSNPEMADSDDGGFDIEEARLLRVG